MSQKIISSLCLLVLLISGNLAQAAISVDITAEKEVVVVENNKEIRKVFPATETQAGEIIFFTVNYFNEGEQPVRNIQIDNPIPPSMTYIPGTVWGENSDIVFSIDHSKTFKKPSLLTYEVVDAQGKEIKKVASPEEYTDIRWIISEVAAGGKGQVGFKARVR